MASQQTRSARIEARVTPEILRTVKRAAELQGRSLSDFVVNAAAQAARQTIEDMNVVRLSADDQQRFVESLLNPSEPAPAMKRAREHHRRLIEDS